MLRILGRAQLPSLPVDDPLTSDQKGVYSAYTRMTGPVETLTGPLQGIEKRGPVIVRAGPEKDIAPVVTRSCDVIKRARKFEP